MSGAADDEAGRSGRPVSAVRSGRREIDHTADLGFEVWAATPAELIRQATLALAELCYDRDGVRPCERRSLRVSGAGREELLVRWLQDVYLLLEQEAWLTADVEIVVYDRERIEGTLLGEPLERRRHTLHTEIKAITYHRLTVAPDHDGIWRTRVIVDV